MTILLLTLLIINLSLSAYLIGKVWNIKEVTVKETVKEIREVAVEKIVYKFPELMSVDPLYIAKMPVAAMSERNIEVIIRSMTENPELWSFDLGWLGGVLYCEGRNKSGQKIKLRIDGQKEGKTTKVVLTEPTEITFDAKWNPVFHNLTWKHYHTLWTASVQTTINKQNKLTTDIEDLLDKGQKRDNNIDKLID